MSSYIYEQAHLKEVDDDRGVCVDGCICACMKHRDQNNFTDLIISLRFICVSVVPVMTPFLILNLFFFYQLSDCQRNYINMPIHTADSQTVKG